MSWDRDHMNAKVNLKNRDIDDPTYILTAREREEGYREVIHTSSLRSKKFHSKYMRWKNRKKNQNTILYVTLFILLSLLW